MKNAQEKKKEEKIMDSFVRHVWFFVLIAFMFPAFGALAQDQDNMKKTKTDTSRTKSVKKTTRTTTTTDTSKTYRYNKDQTNQNMNQQNQNQNQQNRNRYDNQRGDTLQDSQSRDAVLIENDPRK